MNDKDLLSPQERQEFRDLEDMFGSRGWLHMRDKLTEEVEQGPAYWFANAESWDQILAARARIRAVLELLNYETITETRKANLVEGRRQQALVDDDDASLEHF